MQLLYICKDVGGVKLGFYNLNHIIRTSLRYLFNPKKYITQKQQSAVHLSQK
jgi:hypothetical protein